MKKTLNISREEKKYETLLDISGIGVFEVNLNGQKGNVTQPLQQLLDIREEAISFKEFVAFIHNDNRFQIEEELINCLNKNKIFEKDFVLEVNNTKIHVQGLGKVIPDTEILLLKINPLKSPAETLKITNVDRIAGILDFLPTPLLIISEDGKICHINAALTEVTGYTHAEIPTVKDWAKSAYGDSVETHEEIINQLFNITHYRNDGEFKFITKQNIIKHLHFYTAPLGYDENGNKIVLSVAADVTEVREKENLLQSKAQELTILTNELPHLIFTSDKDGKSEYINEKWADFTGTPIEELRDGKADVIHPDDKPKFEKYGEMSRTGVKPFDLDVRIKHHSGMYRWINIKAVPVINNNNELMRWIGTGTDVHDKYIAEKNLRHKANEFISLVEMLNHHVWVIKADGTPEYFNKAWYEYTGLSEEETIKDRLQAVHPSQREKVKFHTELAWKKKKPYEINVKLRRHDGEYEWFLSKGQPILDNNNELIKFVGTITNIHTHRQLEEALKHEVAELSEIIESVPLIAWTADLEGNIDFYNKRWYEYTGLTPKESLGWGWGKAQHPEDAENSLEVVIESLKIGKGFELEARFLRAKDNKYRWHIIKVAPVKNPTSEVKYWIGTATDIHEQKMLEHNKGQFLNIASHELRTPLTTLMGYLQLMEQAISEGDLQGITMFHKKSAGSSEKLSRLINDLLNLSSIDSGKIEIFHKEKFEINNFIKEILNNYQQLHPQKSFTFEGNGSLMVNANIFHIEQVMDNLLINVFKYAPASSITVKVKGVDEKVLISVIDKGPGIPQNKLEAIFDRFYRVIDNGTTSGLGVGLFISKEIIEKHNGRIWAESTPGEGSVFSFELPQA